MGKTKKSMEDKKRIKEERIGTISINSQGYKMIVIDYENNKKITVQFEDEYNTVLENKSWDDFIKGKIKNPNHRTFFGVGYIGVGKHHSTRGNNREMRLWSGMLRRCYSRATEAEREKHKTYDGVTVCDRWHSFQNFCDDLPLIENYELWRDNEDYVLDKDLKQIGVENKVYSLNTCKFVTASENSKEAIIGTSLEPKAVIGINAKTGEIAYVFNACRDGIRYGFDNSSISKCCRGKYSSKDGKTYKGIIWYYKKDYESLINE